METTKLPEKGKQMELLKLYLKNGQRENYYLILGEIVSRLNQFESMHDMNALELYYSVSVLMMQYINEQGISEKLAFRIGLYKLMNFNEDGSWAEAGSYLYDLSDVIFEEGEGTDESLSDRSLEKLTAYIEENLAGDLTLTQLAAVSGFNSSYLSRIFKQNRIIGIYPEKTNGTVQTASLVYRGKSPDHREKSRLSVFTFLFADVPCLHGNVTE